MELGRKTRHQQAAKSAKQNRTELKAKLDARKIEEGNNGKMKRTEGNNGKMAQRWH
jgi:hypothetical protein